jgi:hypothetical protein
VECRAQLAGETEIASRGDGRGSKVNLGAEVGEVRCGAWQLGMWVEER